MGERYGTKNRGKTRKSPIQLIFRGVWARELGWNETYIYQFESESGAGEKFNFWELFSPKFETKYFIFDETYMFRIKTEHISERALDLHRGRDIRERENRINIALNLPAASTACRKE